MERVSKHNYYLDIAQTVSERSTCLRKRYGSIIVKNDSIVSTGYNGAPRGRKNCCDLGTCIRDEMKIPRGERYELCRSVHSVANCMMCKRQILNAGIDKVYIRETKDTYREITVSDWIEHDDSLDGTLGY